MGNPRNLYNKSQTQLAECIEVVIYGASATNSIERKLCAVVVCSRCVGEKCGTTGQCAVLVTLYT